MFWGGALRNDTKNGFENLSLACENIRFSSLFAAERGETDVFAG